MNVRARLRCRELEHSRLYSEELGIELRRSSDDQCFRWFLASLLFGARISETIAKNTYQAFVRHDLVSPTRILAAGIGFLVDPIMREGGYVRYDGRKSNQIVQDCQKLLDDYAGSLRRLHRVSESHGDLERRLLDFYGVGPVTVNVFLRELRPHWAKADPDPLPVVRQLAKQLGIRLGAYDRKAMHFVRLEAGLIRARHILRAGARGFKLEPSPRGRLL